MCNCPLYARIACVRQCHVSCLLVCMFVHASGSLVGPMAAPIVALQQAIGRSGVVLYVSANGFILLDGYTPFIYSYYEYGLFFAIEHTGLSADSTAQAARSPRVNWKLRSRASSARSSTR